MPPSVASRLFAGYRKCFWVLAAVVAGLDQWTKHVFYGMAPDSEIVLLRRWLSLVSCPLNKQTAFSLGPSAPAFYIIVGVVGVALIGYFFLSARADRLWPHLTLGAICGGAVGNLIDRVALGGVRDFIDLHWADAHWPTFNVADMGISVGVVLLLLEALLPVRGGRQEGHEAEGEGEAG